MCNTKSHQPEEWGLSQRWLLRTGSECRQGRGFVLWGGSGRVSHLPSASKSQWRRLWPRGSHFCCSRPGAAARGLATAGTMAGNRRPCAILAAGQAPEPRGAAAASAAPPVLFPSHCPEERKDVSSLLPFCLKGTRGGERILLAAACAIGTTAALGRADPLRPGRGAAESRCCRRCCCLRVLHHNSFK